MALDNDPVGQGIEDILNKILGENGKAHCLPMNQKGIAEFASYMANPIIEIRVSRIGCNVTVQNCSLDDVDEFIGDGIGRLLNLIPEERRNDVLVRAINIPDSKEGELYEDDEESDDDEE